MYYRVNVAELKKAMIDSGFSKVKDLSQATGIDRNTLGKILNEKAIPSSRAMYALVSTLNLSYYVLRNIGRAINYKKLIDPTERKVITEC